VRGNQSGAGQSWIHEMQIAFLIKGLIIAACLSVLGIFFQSRQGSWRCSLDGSVINPLYEVEIIEANELSRKFSCVGNARIWLQRNTGAVRLIRVTDEMSQEKITAEKAFYVLSTVMTTPHTGDKIHVFGSREAAQAHARQFAGVMVDNPLRVCEKKPTIRTFFTSESPNIPGLVLISSFKPIYFEDDPLPGNLPVFDRTLRKFLGRLLEGHEKRHEKPPEAEVPDITCC
jgi:hypothetical protein